MDTGEWLTRGTVWVALLLYAAAELSITRQAAHHQSSLARWLNTAGAVAFLGHVACAFHFHHEWSHSVAYSDTAKQTAELVGWNTGSGLYLNYCFTLLWLGEVIWFWMAPTSHARRNQWFSRIIRGFFFFMIFNGAVVFVRGPIRWLGLIICLTLVVCWWRSWRRTEITIDRVDRNP